MDIQEIIDEAVKSNDFTLLIFFADWSPHYDWMDRAISDQHLDIEVIRINIEEDKRIADEYNIEIVPGFVLFKGDRILWKQTGEVTPAEFKEVVTMFS